MRELSSYNLKGRSVMPRRKAKPKAPKLTDEQRATVNLIAQRSTRTYLNAAIRCVAPIKVQQLKRGPWRIRGIQPNGVETLVNNIAVGWEVNSVVSVMEDPADMQEAFRLYVISLNDDNDNAEEQKVDLEPWLLVADIINGKLDTDPTFVVTTDWLLSDEVHWDWRIFIYIDGNHRLAAVNRLNITRSSWTEAEADEWEAKGIFAPILSIPSCALYDINTLASHSITELDIATFLNHKAENVSQTVLDKLYLIRVHVS
jgi:hypothetical protein